MPDTRPKLGILALSDANSIDVLLKSLAELGWINSKTFEVVFPAATQDLAKLAGNMQQLLAAGVDVIVAQTKPAIVIAQRATTRPHRDGRAQWRPGQGGLRQQSRPSWRQHYRQLLQCDVRGGRPRRSVMRINADHEAGGHRVQSGQRRVFSIVGGAPQRRKRANSTRCGCRFAAVMRSTRRSRRPRRTASRALSPSRRRRCSIRREVAAAQIKHRMPAVMGSIGFPELGGLAKFGPRSPRSGRRSCRPSTSCSRGTANSADLPLITVDGFQLDIDLQTAALLNLAVPLRCCNGRSG